MKDRIASRVPHVASTTWLRTGSHENMKRTESTIVTASVAQQATQCLSPNRDEGLQQSNIYQKARGAARRECNDAQQTIDSGTDSSVTSDSIRPKVPIAPESSANAV